MYGSYSKIAGGDIYPARFVKLVQVNGEPVVLQCAANDPPWGISQPNTRRINLPGYNDGLAAVAGQMLNIFGPGDDAALLEIAEAVAAGDYLKSDANGKGVKATAANDAVGAQALVGGQAGDVIRVKPIRFNL